MLTMSLRHYRARSNRIPSAGNRQLKIPDRYSRAANVKNQLDSVGLVFNILAGHSEVLGGCGKSKPPTDVANGIH